MKHLSLGFALLVTVAAAADAQSRSIPNEPGAELRWRLLGTTGGPVMNAQRLGISTLVEAGTEKLVFDCGRGSSTGLSRLGIPVADVRKVFTSIPTTSSASQSSISFRGHRAAASCRSKCGGRRGRSR